MTTLDGVERAFDAETVLVCDRDGPSGIAGIMGGERSEVSDGTSRVLLEVATWNGVNILRTSTMLGPSDGRVDAVREAASPRARATGTARRLAPYGRACGAALVPGTIDVAADIPAPHVISLRGARLDSLLGAHVERDEARGHPRGPRVRGRAGGRARPAGHRAGGSPLRRHPRGRPDRGGRAPARPRPAAADAARLTASGPVGCRASRSSAAAPRTCCATSASTRSSRGGSSPPTCRTASARDR